jgi:hypothetical protein
MHRGHLRVREPGAVRDDAGVRGQRAGGSGRARRQPDALAARFTADRRPNFDIYLPQWLARYNQPIFGSLYVAGLVYTLVLWLRVRQGMNDSGCRLFAVGVVENHTCNLEIRF